MKLKMQLELNMVDYEELEADIIYVMNDTLTKAVTEKIKNSKKFQNFVDKVSSEVVEKAIKQRTERTAS